MLGQQLRSIVGSESKQLFGKHVASMDPTTAWKTLRPSVICEEKTLVDPTLPKAPGTVRFVCISDTHGHIGKVEKLIPEGDVLIHAGDFTKSGESSSVQQLSEMLGRLPHKHKIVIAGNHDLSFEPTTFDDTFARFGRGDREEHRHAKRLLTNCTYLEDSGVEVEGIKIWGSPWTPAFYDWAFNAQRGAECAAKWNLIPDDTDVLITHGPPLGYGDLCFSGQRAGCLDLLQVIRERVRPAYHVFGHVHEGYGATTDGVTTFVNASTCDLRYRPVQPPLVFDVCPRRAAAPSAGAAVGDSAGDGDGASAGDGAKGRGSDCAAAVMDCS